MNLEIMPGTGRALHRGRNRPAIRYAHDVMLIPKWRLAADRMIDWMATTCKNDGFMND